MAYVKWVANQDRHNDWTTVELLADGTEVRMGTPVDLKADLKKEMEARGRIFEDSSKEEAEQLAAQQVVEQPVGADVAGSAPVFADAPQTDQTDQGGKAANKNS